MDYLPCIYVCAVSASAGEDAEVPGDTEPSAITKVTDITAMASGNHRIVNASSMNYSLTSYLRSTMHLSSDNINAAETGPLRASMLMSNMW